MDCVFHIEGVWEGNVYSKFLESILASLYAGAFFQFTMGLMGESALWIFIRPLIIGGVGLRLMYFHLLSFCMLNWHMLKKVPMHTHTIIP